MSRLQIDFAPAGLRRTVYHLTPAAWFASILALALCISAVLAGYRMLEQERTRQALQRRAQERSAARTHAPAPVPKTVIPQAQANAVNAAVSQLNLPWRDLQDAVVAATGRSVALLALEPDARKRVLKLTAEVKSSEAMIGYIQELKQQEFFSSVLLTRHEMNETDPNKPLRFQLELHWNAP